MKLSSSLLSLLAALPVYINAPALASEQTRALTAPTLTAQVDGANIAYRLIGPNTGKPLLLLNRFRGTMDDWDPVLIDRLATQRLVILFDQPGFARSSGSPPDSLSAFARSAVRLLDTLGHSQVDVLGFSMGGTVALQFALDHPQRLRQLVVAGSGPGFVPNIPPGPPPSDRVWPVATKPVNDDGDFLFLFFEESESSQSAGRSYRDRLRQRADAFAKVVAPPAWQAQLKSAMAVNTEGTSLLPRLKLIYHPTLVANGRRDIMVPTYASYAMAQAIPNARLVIYPDSGHGFLFQYPEKFADEVLQFLQ